MRPTSRVGLTIDLNQCKHKISYYYNFKIQLRDQPRVDPRPGPGHKSG